jgi:GxxExxY protein
MELNEITQTIIGCAICVHKALGPGLLESTYEVCLVHELSKSGLKVRSQDGMTLDAGHRIDLLVGETVIVELKAVEAIHRIHEAQVISYLKLSGKKVGLLINFNVKMLTNGIKRLAN